MNELLPIGNQTVFNNRVGWVRSHPKQAGLLAAPKRGYFKITEPGLRLLAEKPKNINVALLQRYPEFKDLRNRKKDQSKINDENITVKMVVSETPEDALASAYRSLRMNLEDEIISSVKNPRHRCQCRRILLLPRYRGILFVNALPTWEFIIARNS